MVDNYAWGADPQGPRAGMTYPPPNKIVLQIGVNGVVALNLNKMAHERGMTRLAYAEQLFMAAYSSRCAPSGDSNLDESVRQIDAGALKELRGEVADLKNKAESWKRKFDDMHEQRAKLANDIMAERGKVVLAKKEMRAEVEKLAGDAALLRNALTMAQSGEKIARTALDTARIELEAMREAAKPKPASARSLTPQAQADALTGAVVRHVRERWIAGMDVPALAALAKVSNEAIEILLKLNRDGKGHRVG